MSSTLKSVDFTRLKIHPLVMLQLPLEPVVQLGSVPPAGEKEPLTTAPACAAPELFLTLTMTVARHLFFCDALLPVRPEMATLVGVGSAGAGLGSVMGSGAGSSAGGSWGVGAGSVIGAVASSEYKSKLAEPAPPLVTTPFVACSLMRVASSAGDASVLASRVRASTPATWGAAMEVPLMVASSLGEESQAEVMALPGANKSKQVPKFE